MPTAPRPLDPTDAEPLAALYAENRQFLEPWQPQRPEAYFTEAGQRQAVEEALAQQASGNALPLAIIEPSAAMVGTLTDASIVRGAFQAETLTHIKQSQRVLARVGFRQYGVAPSS